MTRPIRVATICHNDQSHRRVRLELHKTDYAYRWFTEEGQECGVPDSQTIYDAEIVALQAWGAAVWDLRATWRP